MAKRKSTAEPSEPEVNPHAAVVVTATVNAGDNGTIVNISGAGAGGHRASLLAITPEKRTQTVGDVTWDGDEHTFELPYVATEVRVMEWLNMTDYEPILVSTVEPYSEPPPETP